MSKSILEEAMNDAKLLKETAIENARNVLVEAISPQIKEFVEQQLGEDGNLAEMPEELKDLDPDTLEKVLHYVKSMHTGGDSEMEEAEGSAPEFGGDDDSMSLSFGDDEGSDDMEEAKDDDETEEGMYEGDKPDEDDEMSETVEITQEDLAKAWKEVVREAQLTEAEVSKDFGDVDDPNDKEGPGERGLEDKEKEQMWKDHEPPAGEDWTVESLKRTMGKLQKENSKLKTENKKLNLGVSKLKRSLSEVNLFNSKLLYTNRLMQNANLTNEQRLTVIESFDSAQNLREVELVYKSLSESFKIAGVLGESSKKKGSVRPRSSSYTTSASANMLREQANRDESGSETFKEHMQRLANLLD